MGLCSERLNWIGGVYATFLSGVSIYALKNKHVRHERRNGALFTKPRNTDLLLQIQLPPVLGLPIFVSGVFVAYQWDFCYGTKLERINKMTEELAKEEHWFNPSLPSDEDVNKLKR